MGFDPQIERDKIEAGADLTIEEVKAARAHLRRHAQPDGTLPGCWSYLQRHMQIGFNHAMRIVDLLEAEHFIGPRRADGTRKLIG